MPAPPVLRFAPSPNGSLHLGHALSALTGFEMARRLGGRFLLRIEDIDVARCREEHVAGILEDLGWLGITWEGPVLRQSQRFGVYAQAAQQLEAAGLLYPCFATRSDIAAASPASLDPEGAPIYPGLRGGGLAAGR
jgi:glutamyl-Q tRNA(Asp) synthetase